MNLILLEADELSGNGHVILRGARAEHICSVLKKEAGDEIRIGVIDGPTGTGTIQSSSAGAVALQCKLNSETPARPAVDLLLALPRPKVMKRLWAQLAALGVGRIILTNAWKVEKNYFDTHVLDSEFYRPRLIEGLQQAGDTRLPEVSIHKRFKVLIEDELDELFPDGARLAADPRAAVPVREALGRDRVLVAVGPEGGWTEYEVELLKSHGFRSVGVGPRVLRTDTACVALLAVVHDALPARG